ncbi:hypothetical protein KAW48_03975 [candidate division WOR-3 bacterium]|nr:hypothetical protein [candidate division WOR-3 bacterium]
MSFTSTELRRSLGEFEHAAKNLLNATHQTYQSEMYAFMHQVHKDEIINYILKPFLEMSLDFSKIEKPDPSVRILELPNDMNKQIAYILQILSKSYKGELSIEQCASHFFPEENVNKSFYLFIENKIKPNIKVLIEMLRDLISYEIKGKKEVMEENLRIL